MSETQTHQENPLTMQFGKPAAYLSDDQIVDLLQGGSTAGRFEVLNRKGRPISEEQAAGILLEQAPQSTASSPLPLARPANLPPLPLTYQPPRHRRVSARQIIELSRLPLAYRMLRVGLWLSVAAAMAAVFAHALFA